MHDLLFEHQDALRPAGLVGYADQLGLDVERFKHHLREPTGAHRVAEDVEDADSPASPAPRPGWRPFRPSQLPLAEEILHFHPDTHPHVGLLPELGWS
jgi:hypothetical protein